jgi:perosamine synthetase
MEKRKILDRDTERGRATTGKQDEEPIAFSRPYLGDAEEAAVVEALRSGWIVGGDRLAEFERRFASECGVAHAVAVTSCTTGAFLVLRAWGVGPGDEVIVPSLTFIASVNVIRHVGATPVFAEIEPATFNIDPSDVARKVTSRTKAILPVDQIGLPCDIDAMNVLAKRHGLKVLDDAACALGSLNRGRPVGSLAEASVFSLHARKVITTGEGGMIVTDNGAFARRLRTLRHQGMSLSDVARHCMRPTVFETYPEIGYNFRMTDLQAAMGLKQLDRLGEILQRRRKVAETYNCAFAEHPLLSPPHVPESLQPNWQSYQVVIRAGSPLGQTTIMDRLYDLGVPTRRGVMASHREAPYLDPRNVLPVTELVASNTLQLPMHPGLTQAQLDRILAAVQSLS